MIERLHVSILARGQLMQRPELDGESSVAHRGVYMGDRVAGHAPQSILRFRGVHLFLDRALEPAIEKDGMIVTPGTPLAALDARDILHVFDGLPIELVVERREV